MLIVHQPTQEWYTGAVLLKDKKSDPELSQLSKVLFFVSDQSIIQKH